MARGRLVTGRGGLTLSQLLLSSPCRGRPAGSGTFEVAGMPPEERVRPPRKSRQPCSASLQLKTEGFCVK
jgi:hypothetical protein